MSQQEKKGGILFKVLAFVFLAVAVIAFVLWFTANGKLTDLQKEKEAQRVELQGQLDQMMADHHQLKAENKELTAELAEKDSVIQEKAAEIKKALNYKWSYYQIKKKFEALQVVSQDYVRKISELKEENQKLLDENQIIKGQYAAEKKKTSELTKVKEELTEQVDKASVVRAFTVNAMGVRATSSGRERETDRARRVNMIKVCFTLAENIIADAGPKDIFIRIADADNKILVKGLGDEYSFNYNGETLQYSIKKTVDYKNEAVAVCAYWNKRETQDIPAGNYKVEIYSENEVIGHANFELR